MVRFSGQDLGPCLVFMGTVWANVSWVTEAIYPGPLPVLVERRPVSIYRLADNLSIPYETVRRHVARLVDAGFLVRDDQGVVAPDEVFRRPGSLEVLAGAWASTVKLQNDLKALGVELPAPAATVAPEAHAWVGRLSAAFVLEGVDLITQALQADPVSGLIYLAINRENLADVLADPERVRGRLSPQGIVPDALRRPVSVYRIARILSLPYETARRHVVQLVDAGWLARSADGGLITVGGRMAQSGMQTASAKAWPLVRRFMDRVASLGLGGQGDV